MCTWMYVTHVTVPIPVCCDHAVPFKWYKVECNSLLRLYPNAQSIAVTVFDNVTSLRVVARCNIYIDGHNTFVLLTLICVLMYKLFPAQCSACME